MAPKPAVTISPSRGTICPKSTTKWAVGSPSDAHINRIISDNAMRYRGAEDDRATSDAIKHEYVTIIVH